MYRYEFLYYNALINNIDSKGIINQEPHLVFKEERDGPLIKNCQDYDMSI